MSDILTSTHGDTGHLQTMRTLGNVPQNFMSQRRGGMTLNTSSADAVMCWKHIKCIIENMKLIPLTKYKYSSIQQMYKNKAFAKLKYHLSAGFTSVLFCFVFFTLQGSGCFSPNESNHLTAPSLCNSFFPLESSPFFFLVEYVSSGALIGPAGPTMAGPEPGTCGRTVGEAALLGGPDFSNGT